MPRLGSSLTAAGPTGGSATASTRLVGQDISEMSDDELLAAIQTLRGARTMSPAASRRPGAATAPKAPPQSASSIADDDIG